MNTIIKKIRAVSLIITTAAAFAGAGSVATAQQNTNGWPIVPQYVTATPVRTGVPGPGTPPLNAVTLYPASTNSYVPGTLYSTNMSGAGMNQVYIDVSGYSDVGLNLSSLTGMPTNLTGVIVCRLAKSCDGLTCEATPSVVLTCSINSTNNNKVFTDVDVHGCQGLFVTSLECTNAGVNSITNLVTLQPYEKYSKVGAVPVSPMSN